MLSGVLRVCPEIARPSTPPPSTSAPGGEGTSKGDVARSAPLPKDVLGIAVLDEERVVAVLGVSLALSVLLEDYTEPGWLPAAIDEEHVPLNGLFAQLPSFCFTENYRGVVPICVVRQSPITLPPTHVHARLPLTSPPRPLPQTPPVRPSQMRQFVSLLVQRLRMHVGELVMAYALVESVLRNFPTTMRVNSVRPMLLGACFIACKTSRD